MIPMIQISDYVHLPMIGLGLFRHTDLATMRQVVSDAYGLGYRLFDTAQMYDNEACLGQALTDLGLPRAELFITTKIDNENQGFDRTLESFEQSLSDLQTDYVDLLLIHWPGQDQTRTMSTWRALEKINSTGRARAIGVSNFLPKHLVVIQERATVQPAVNQIERNPYNTQNHLIPTYREAGINIQAWSPLRKGQALDPLLHHLGTKYGKTPAQIALRWNVQDNVMIIPKATSHEHLRQNLDILDFQLEQVDMDAISRLDQQSHLSFDPETFDF